MEMTHRDSKAQSLLFVAMDAARVEDYVCRDGKNKGCWEETGLRICIHISRTSHFLFVQKQQAAVALAALFIRLRHLGRKSDRAGTRNLKLSE